MPLSSIFSNPRFYSPCISVEDNLTFISAEICVWVLSFFVADMVGAIGPILFCIFDNFSKVLVSYIILQHFIETVKRCNPCGINGMNPGGFHGPPLPFTFAFAGTVPYAGMDQINSKRNTNHGKLFVSIRSSIVDEKFGRNATISGYRFLQNFLEVTGIVVVKHLCPDKHSGMVINNGHAVNLAGNTVFGDMCNVTGVSLPHFSELVLFKDFPVP